MSEPLGIADPALRGDIAWFQAVDRRGLPKEALRRMWLQLVWNAVHRKYPQLDYRRVADLSRWHGPDSNVDLDPPEQDVVRQLSVLRKIESTWRLRPLCRETVLALHDVAAVLGRTCGAEHVSLWRQSGRTSEVVTELTRSGSPARRVQIRGAGLCEGPQEFVVPPFPAAVVALAGDECSAAYIVPTWTAQDTTVLVVLGYAGEKPDWVSLPLATIQVQFLAHRLIVSEADRRAGLAAAAARLGMQLDPDIASRLGVMPSDLEHLQRWRTRCQQAMGVVNHLVAFFLLGSAETLRLSGLIKVESRVKTADSILSKFLPPSERVWPEYEKLEDVAGVRVICPTRSDLRPIEEFLVSEKAAAHGVRLHSTICPARRDYIASPTTGGYRAIHLVLEVETRLGDEGTQAVPCEVQLRTMFQDVWAAISHATLYGADRQQRRRHGEKLPETAAALERCQHLLDELVSGE